MVDGVRLVVPNLLERMTSYLLFEQQDWFEHERKFLHCQLQTGRKVGVIAPCTSKT